MTLVIELVGALGDVVRALEKVIEKGSTSLGQLKVVLEKVIDVVLGVVDKLVEGVGKMSGKGIENAKEKIGEAQAALGEGLSMNGKGLLQQMWKAIKDEKEKSLPKLIEVSDGKLQVDPGKNTIKGIGKGCTCPGGGGNCCGTGVKPCHECTECGTSSADNKCYQSAYKKESALWTAIVNGTPGSASSSTVNTVRAAQDVHLLARIFLGSVCLIWSGLSQLGWLTKGGSGGINNRWSDSSLHEIKDDGTSGLGSFMAAMGYDLERLNQGQGNKNGEFVWKLLSGEEPTEEKNRIKWKEFASVKSNTGKSVAEYYSSIYSAAQGAGTGSTEDICKEYALLVLHILASGYFRAGSAGANKVPVAPKAPPSDPRKPRTIREILYWLSALPYSQGYKGLVDRMEEKMDQMNNKQDKLALEGITTNDSTTLKRNDITHYLMAACGYCPLVLIGIQGTISTSGADPATGNSNGNNQGGSPNQNNGNDRRCPEHSKDRNKRCIYDEKKTTDAAAQAQQQSTTTGEPLKAGQVCYGGYHLAVSSFGPLHGMYANGLFGFDMDGSPAQCLDQLRIYVYHCFYQLYFLRKQCSTGVENKAVLGWKSCRYGKEVKWSSSPWLCSVGTPGGNGNCKCKEIASHSSPLMAFLCDELKNMHCPTTYGSTNNERNPYPNIEDHMEAKKTIQPGHFGAPPKHCPVPMGWSAESTSSGTTSGQVRVNHFKDLTQGTHKTQQLTGGTATHYPAHCTGNTLSLLLEYYCDPDKCSSGTPETTGLYYSHGHYHQLIYGP